MIRRLKKYIALGLIFCTLLGLGSCQINKSIQRSNEKKYIHTAIINEDNKVLEKESVVEAVNELCKLEVLQVQLSKGVKIKQGKYFKKEKDIKLYANCKYILDLEKIKENNVIINGNEIIIFCSNPSIEVTILESMTEFTDTKNSFLSFGDLELDSESWNSILVETKNSIQIESSKYIDEAKVKAENSIEKALSTLTKNNYRIEVRWVD